MATASAQSTPVPEQPVAEMARAGEDRTEGADSDPVKVVLFNLRNEFMDLNGGNWINATILRSDRAVLRNNGVVGKLGVLSRFDLPINVAEVSSSTHAGLGDLYAQAFLFPFLTQHFALFAGTGMLFPTATDDALGAGKWTVAPLAGPLLFFDQRRGLAYLKIQDYISFAGDSGRRDVNYLLITPTLIWRFIPGWWTLLQEESRIDFVDGTRAWYKAGVQMGHMFTKKFGFWFQPEILWGASRPGDYNLKCSLVWNY
jgi:hypothetical protein